MIYSFTHIVCAEADFVVAKNGTTYPIKIKWDSSVSQKASVCMTVEVAEKLIEQLQLAIHEARKEPHHE